MRIHELNVPSNKNSKRKGRGISAGQGKTAGRGTKGQKARSGGSLRPGFEGGQNPLIQRLPKLPGFKSRRQPVQTVTLSDIALIKGKTVDNKTLSERGVTASPYQPVKVVASGELKSAKNVKVQAASKQAIVLIEKAGGTFVKTDSPKPKASAAADTKSA